MVDYYNLQTRANALVKKVNDYEASLPVIEKDEAQLMSENIYCDIYSLRAVFDWIFGCDSTRKENTTLANQSSAVGVGYYAEQTINATDNFNTYFGIDVYGSVNVPNNWARYNGLWNLSTGTVTALCVKKNEDFNEERFCGCDDVGCNFGLDIPFVAYERNTSSQSLLGRLTSHNIAVGVLPQDALITEAQVGFKAEELLWSASRANQFDAYNYYNTNNYIRTAGLRRFGLKNGLSKTVKPIVYASDMAYNKPLWTTSYITETNWVTARFGYILPDNCLDNLYTSAIGLNLFYVNSYYYNLYGWSNYDDDLTIPQQIYFELCFKRRREGCKELNLDFVPSVDSVMDNDPQGLATRLALAQCKPYYANTLWWNELDEYYSVDGSKQKALADLIVEATKNMTDEEYLNNYKLDYETYAKVTGDPL